MRVSRRGLLVAAGAAAALLLVARVLSALYADYAWYDALGAEALWRAKVVNTVLLRGAAWVAGSAIVFLNLYAVRGSVLRLIVPRRVANLEIDAEVPGRLLVGGAALVALGVGALLMLAQEEWTTLAAARYAVPFGESDHYFSHDLAFWTAWLPLERAWFVWAEATLVVVCCMVAALYALTASLRWERGVLHVAPYVRRHFSVLGALLLLLLAWGYRVERYMLVVDGGPQGWFAYAEQGTLTPLLVLSVLTVACAFLVLWSGFTGQTRLAFAGVTLAIVLAVGLQQLTPALLRWQARDVPASRALDPYLATRHRFTQRAYGVSRIPHADSAERFADPSAIVGRVSLADRATVLAAVERAAPRRVPAGGVGWGVGPAGELQAVVAVRDEAADGSSRWFASVADGARDPSGGRGLPRPTSRPLPEVLVHEGALGYAVVADPRGAVAAPALVRPWERLAHALAVQNLRLWAGRPPAERSVIVERRDVRERVGRLAPVFALGTDVVPRLRGDSLYWAVHLYAVSRTYPLSEPLPRAVDDDDPERATKYLRHAGTALVNAHTGRVSIYRAPDADPLASAWTDRFPSLYRRWSDAPVVLQHLAPPPVDAARAQAFAVEMAGGAGIPADSVRRPREAADSTTAGERLVPYGAPADSGATAIALPLVGRPAPGAGSEDGPIRALVVATGGPASRVAVVPVASPAEPWGALVDALRATAAAAADDGARLDFGQLRIVPALDGAVLVLPAFDRPDGEDPVLRSVAVAMGDSVRAGRTLADALVGGRVTAAPGDSVPDAAALYRRMRDALRDGDWTAFGAAFEALGRRLAVPPPR